MARPLLLLSSCVMLAACAASGDTSNAGSTTGADDDGGNASLATTDGGSGDASSASATDAGSNTGADAGSSSALRYDHDGPLAFTTESAALTNGTHAFTELAYVPTSAGLHPVVSISPGLLQKAAAYAPFASRLASYGIMVLLRDDPGPLTVTTDVAADVEYAVGTWLPTAYAGKVDLAHVGLAGHSRGGKTTLLAAEQGLKGKVVAWFGLDPVDTTTVSGGKQARDTLPQIGIPTVYLEAEVASTCSPAADGAETLFPVSPSPSVKIVGLGAGHTQLQDQASCTQCNLCTPAGKADPKIVLAYAVRYMTAFFSRELLAATDVGPAFEMAGASADVQAGHVSIDAK